MTYTIYNNTNKMFEDILIYIKIVTTLHLEIISTDTSLMIKQRDVNIDYK